MLNILVDNNTLHPSIADTIRGTILNIADSEWFRYDNPFEKKTALGYTGARVNAPYITTYIGSQLRAILQNKFGIYLRVDEEGAFTSIFKYNIGDYLQPHLDAGIVIDSEGFPLRKRVTVLLYLSTDDAGGGELVFYDGIEKPESISKVIETKFNTLVAFENTDYSWHGVKLVTRGTRIVVTASYLCADIDGFLNNRRKAYFAPVPGVEWPEELYRLRDDRADPNKAAQVYVSRR